MESRVTLGISRGHLLHHLSFPVLTAVAPGGRGTSPKSLSKLEAELGQGIWNVPGLNRCALWGIPRTSEPAVLPPTTFLSPSRPSNSNLLSLLQVNLVLGDGRSLGLTIRGGAEYGLGIYVTGVDPGSEAESSGLKVSGPTPTGGDGCQGCMRGAKEWKELCVELFAADFAQTCCGAVSTHPL